MLTRRLKKPTVIEFSLTDYGREASVKQENLCNFVTMENNVMKALRSCPLFAGMSEIEIDLTLGNISYQLVSLPAHEVYALAGMPCKYVDIVVSGKLICRMAALSGKTGRGESIA